MTGLVVELDGARHHLARGPAYHLVERRGRLALDRRPAGLDCLGYFVAGAAGWYFRTEDLGLVRDLRLGRNAVTERTTAIAADLVRVGYDRPEPVREPPPARRTPVWSILIFLTGVPLAIATNMASNWLSLRWAWPADGFWIMIVMLAVTLLGSYLTWRHWRDGAP